MHYDSLLQELDNRKPVTVARTIDFQEDNDDQDQDETDGTKAGVSLSVAAMPKGGPTPTNNWEDEEDAKKKQTARRMNGHM